MLHRLTTNLVKNFSKPTSKILISNSNSIYFNLATEEYLF